MGPLIPGTVVQRISAYQLQGALDAGDTLRLMSNQFQKDLHSDSAKPVVVVTVFNSTGVEVPAGNIMAVKSPKYDGNLSEDKKSSMRNGINVEVKKPEKENENLVVLLDKLAASGNIGCLAAIMGVVIVKINRTDGSHRFAEPIDGDSAKLTSAGSGPFAILTTEDATGERWEYVRFPAGGGVATREAKIVWVRSALSAGKRVVSDVYLLADADAKPNWGAYPATHEARVLLGSTPSSS